MHLIQPLTSGIRGGELGTAEVYERGTSTFATVYTGFDGSGPMTPTAGLALDANGGRVVYVGEMVTVVVKSSIGVTVREFTDGEEAPAVEVISQSFTGTDYDTGALGTSKPTTLQALLDLWLTQNQEPDWKVRVNGAASTISAALAAVAGIFVNVKAAAYGAVGDGVADDTTAVQAALTAALGVAPASGAIVFFPPGIYRITSLLTVGAGVSLMGCGAQSSAIAVDSAASNGVSFTAADATNRARPQFVVGLAVTVAQNNSGKQVVCEAGAIVTFIACSIGGSQTFSATGTVVSVANAASVVSFYGCAIRSDAAAAVLVSAAVGRVHAIGTTFIHGATNLTSNIILSGAGLFHGCLVDLSAVSNGAANGTVYAGAGGVTVVGGAILNPAVVTTIKAFSSSGAGFFECGLVVPANMKYGFASVSTAAANHGGSLGLAREARRGYVTDDTAAVAVDSQRFGMYEVRRTNNGAQTATLNGADSGGQYFTLTWNNDHAAGGGLITVDATLVRGLANFTVNANRVSHYHFRSVENVAAGGGAGSYYWVLVGSSVNVLP